MTNRETLPRVLFVCCGNTCRSVFAEFLANARLSGIQAEYAGLRPQRASDAKSAIDTLRVQFGIDASRHVPRALASIDLTPFDRIVALDREAMTALKERGISPEHSELWRIRDPWGGDSTDYDSCALAILKS